MRVGYLGVPGSYSYAAAQQFAGEAEYVGYPTFAEVFAAASKGDVDQAVFPIENTLAGSIYENYDLLDKSALTVVGEQYLRIEHNLLVSHQTAQQYAQNPKVLTEVISHPKAIEQCTDFLHDMRWVTVRSFGDTASAAQYVARHPDQPIAAISSLAAGKLYDLEPLAVNIETNSANYTRFLVASAHSSDVPADSSKCTLVVRLKHKQGSLYKALGLLADNNCNLTKIESRPLVGQPFEYLFYIDFMHEHLTEELDRVLTALGEVAGDIKVLGRYVARGY
jgi:prephenate dehydratase